MTKKYSFQLRENAARSLGECVKKSMIVDIFSPVRHGTISIDLAVHLMPEEKIEIKRLHLSNGNLSDPRQTASYFMGYFGLQNEKSIFIALDSLKDEMNGTQLKSEYSSSLWIEFSEQFKEWFQENIARHLIQEAEINLLYFKNKD